MPEPPLSPIAELLPTPIAAIKLSSRASWALHRLGIRTVADAADPERLNRALIFRLPGCGKVTANELAQALRCFGVVVPRWNGP